MEFHPISTIFPLMQGKEFDELVADIDKHGQREIIVVYENKILDGRNRFLACEKLKRAPRIRELNCNDGDPIEYVWSQNYHRRHLEPSQRAMAVVEKAKFQTERERGDRGRFTTTPAGVMVKKGHRFDHDGKQRDNALLGSHASVAEAAKIAGVGSSTINRARVVVKHGTEEEKEAVRTGKVQLFGLAEQILERKGLKGRKLKAPNGMTLEEWARDGMAHENKGMTAEEAAQKIGFHIASYRRVKDLVLLADRNDLPKSEARLVRATLNTINEERQVRVPDEVKNIVMRVWGTRRPKNSKFVENRTEAFLASIDVIYHVCIQEKEIPQLNREQVKFVLENLKEAVDSIIKTMKKVKEIYGE